MSLTGPQIEPAIRRTPIEGPDLASNVTDSGRAFNWAVIKFMEG